ncbi:DUF488 domain-containing protein [Thalassiella azotivora]
MASPPLLTLGHGTASADELVELLRDAGVGSLVDVRRFPGSRRHPHVARDEMARWLPDAGVAYRWEPRLGGRRRQPTDDDADRDGWWRVEAFRAYAAHTRSAEFRAGLADLLAQVAEPVGEGATAVMCSETLWWRCHRRLVSDVAVLLHEVPVEHLDHAGRRTAHPPAEGARVVGAGRDASVVWDGG